MLGLLGRGDRDADARRGVRWLLDDQEADGSWFGRWGVNHVYGTGAVVPALVAAGVRRPRPADPPRRQLARAAPERRRRMGRGLPLLRRSRLDRARREHRLADRLGAAGARTPPASASAAVAARDRVAGRDPAPEDGGWDEPHHTGTGFPSDFYINYHLYRLIFPIMALGRLHGDDALARAADQRAALPTPRAGAARRPATRTSPSPACIVGRRRAVAPDGDLRLRAARRRRRRRGAGDRGALLDLVERELDRVFATRATQPGIR